MKFTVVAQPCGGTHNPVVQRHHRLITQLILRASDIERKIKIQFRDAVVGKGRLFGRLSPKRSHAAGDNIQHRVGD